MGGGGVCGGDVCVESVCVEVMCNRQGWGELAERFDLCLRVRGYSLVCLF